MTHFRQKQTGWHGDAATDTFLDGKKQLDVLRLLLNLLDSSDC